jgi:HSP20 family protein
MPALWSDPFVDLQRQVNRVFDDVVRDFGVTPWSEDGSATITPHINIDETDHAIEVSAELPGVKQEELDVSLDDNILTIRGEKRREHKDERARISECYYGTFQRTIELPFTPNPEQVQAQLENGMLKITLPKPEQVQRTHKIRIGATDGGQAKQAGAQDGQGQMRQDQMSQGQTGQDQTGQGQGAQGAGAQGVATQGAGT